MTELRKCGCGVKLSILNKGTACFRCQASTAAQKLATAPPPRPPRVQRAAAPKPMALPRDVAPTVVQRKGTMDKLVAEEIAIEDVPKDTVPVAKAKGRSGELWEKMLALAPGRALKIANRDTGHAGTTVRDLRAKAKAINRDVMTSRQGTTLFCWLKPVEKTGAAGL